MSLLNVAFGKTFCSVESCGVFCNQVISTNYPFQGFLLVCLDTEALGIYLDAQEVFGEMLACL